MIEHGQKRAMAVGLSGVAAHAREGGTAPGFKAQVDYHSALVEYVGAPSAQSNTDMYYAQQLVEILVAFTTDLRTVRHTNRRPGRPTRPGTSRGKPPGPTSLGWSLVAAPLSRQSGVVAACACG